MARINFSGANGIALLVAVPFALGAFGAYSAPKPEWQISMFAFFFGMGAVCSSIMFCIDYRRNSNARKEAAGRNALLTGFGALKRKTPPTPKTPAK
jgi:cyanate permease